MSLTTVKGTADEVHGTVSGSTISGTSTTTFSPLAGELVRVEVACLNATDHLGDTFTCQDNHGNSYGTPTYTGFDAGGGSGGDGDGGCYLFVWDHVYPVAPGATTIKVTKTNNNAQMDFLILPWRITGHDSDQSTAGKNRFSEVGTSTTTYQISVTTTRTGSMVFLLAAPNHNGGATGPVTPISGTTTDVDWDDATVGSRGTFGHSTSNTGTPGATNFGWTSANPSPNGYGVMGLELLPATGGAVDKTATPVSSATTTATLTWPVNPVAGSKVLVFVSSWSGPVSVTDNGTTPSAFTLDANDNDGGAGSYFAQVWRADNITLPASGQYTVTVTGSVAGSLVAAGRSYTGLAAGGPTATGVQSGGAVAGTTVTSDSVTPPAAAAVVFGGFLSDNTGNPTTINLTTSGATSVGTLTNGSLGMVGAAADLIQVGSPSARTLAWTMGTSADWATVIAAYAPAGSGNAISSLTANMNSTPAALTVQVANPVSVAVTANLESTPAALALAETIDSVVAANMNSTPVAVTLSSAAPADMSVTASLDSAAPAITLAYDGPAQVVMDGNGDLAVAASVVAVPGAVTVLDGNGDLAATGLVVELATAVLDGNGGLSVASSVVAVVGASASDMGGTGDINAAPESAETLLINGQDILQCSEAFTADLSSAVAVPAKRTANVTVPGKHGSVRVARKLYSPAQIPMTIWVRGMNADGTWPSNRDSKFYENLDTLLRMFSGDVTLEHVTPLRTTRVITGEVLDAIDFTRYAWSQSSTGHLGVNIQCWDPFWRDEAPVSAAPISTSSSASRTLAEFAPSTGPVEDAVITFTGPCSNPKLASGDWWVQYGASLTAGQSVSIDCGAWTVTGAGGLLADYSKLAHAGIGPWFALEAAEGGPLVTFSVTGGGTGTCVVAARNSYLGG